MGLTNRPEPFLAGAYGGEGRWDDAIGELELLRRLDPTRLQTVSDLFFACAAKASGIAAWAHPSRGLSLIFPAGLVPSIDSLDLRSVAGAGVDSFDVNQ